MFFEASGASKGFSVQLSSLGAPDGFRPTAPIDEQNTTTKRLFDAYKTTADAVDWDRYQKLLTQFLNDTE